MNKMDYSWILKISMFFETMVFNLAPAWVGKFKLEK
uniref:Uncharacterized protein n=1 Tax=Arundo donax TaxID=35708 RepID=A0A0A8XZ56_ARUDO